ncbi:MAG: hypothetical protein AVDCRST_MAG56-7000 [uncultured Cytophagales bacterium]|uniref:Uncharacterized protein n=1 Tax=uncultured Cytophagales bacterium TaxID=158755 RepID=A0A6J4L5G2_9SPHI|nr:MAG: hypothetical protein AVDCRST_MAG56-7000 [uncultured Cytophagales bacterium]
MPMPPYILDYTSDRSSSAGTSGPKPVVKKSVVLVAAGIALLGASLASHLFTMGQYQRLRASADRQALQYDSLLSAKLQADRQVADLRERLTRLQEQAAPQQSLRQFVHPTANPVRHERHRDQ